jgi:hypothetical protein
MFEINARVAWEAIAGVGRKPRHGELRASPVAWISGIPTGGNGFLWRRFATISVLSVTIRARTTRPTRTR